MNNQPTDGHEGAEGRYTSNDRLLGKDDCTFCSFLFLESICLYHDKGEMLKERKKKE